MCTTYYEKYLDEKYVKSTNPQLLSGVTGMAETGQGNRKSAKGENGKVM